MPPLPNLTSTRFGIVSPATQLRLEVSGRGTPCGNTVRYPAAVVSVTVTFMTTAAAFEGTPPWPATANINVWPSRNWPR